VLISSHRASSSSTGGSVPTPLSAAGVVASPAARWLDAEHDRAQKVKVGADLSVPSNPDVFVIGDTAAVTDQPGIPGTAPAAKQMGRYVGRLRRSAARETCGAPTFRPAQ
jgi:NADH:ubiquinone reductase (H+-translocating)